MAKKKLLIFTGYSGSGKSAALRCIEELGYYCVDNLPATLLPHFATLLQSNKAINKIAIVIDARGKDFMKDLSHDLDDLKLKYDLKIIYFDCSLQIITQRYKESRLKHPLSLHGSIKEGYLAELKLLDGLRQQANIIINTSALNVHGLKASVQKYILQQEKKIFEIHIMSFGFKLGLPFEADIILDVRFLDNPYFNADLKNKSGLNAGVKNFILKDSHTKPFLQKTGTYLDYLIHRYREEGKSYVTIAFGCTGGRHRSVMVAEHFKAFFKKKSQVAVKTYHRDLKAG